MKKIIFPVLGIFLIGGCAFAQSVPTAYTLSRQDLTGTARFMSMGGAFGALGADLSSLSQNPAGIGVYRSNEIGLTFGLNAHSGKAVSGGFSNSTGGTRFSLDNIGAVFTLKLNSTTVPNINIGFTYNKTADFYRRYSGEIPGLRTSISNYIAGVANAEGVMEDDVKSTGSYNPYDPPVGSPAPPWITVMGYEGWLIDPTGDPENPEWKGLFGNGTKGRGFFNGYEKGSVDSYNIALGGNISNIVYWGMDFDITSLDYRLQSAYGEYLDDAYVYNPDEGRTTRSWADFDLYDTYRVHGTGFNFKLGVIIKPIQELRLGVAFHTPTYYNLTETYSDNCLRYDYPFISEQAIQTGQNYVYANDGYPVANDYSLRTPWRVLFSAAGVIGSKFIISGDYEWSGYKGIRYGQAKDYWDYDYGYDWDYPWDWGGWYGKPATKAMPGSPRQVYQSAQDYANEQIKHTFKSVNTFRLGAEYRIIPQFSVRAGYSISTSGLSKSAKDLEVALPGTGLASSYTMENPTYHLTCGVGYRHKGFSADLAYVFRHSSAKYVPFSPDPEHRDLMPKANLKFDTSKVALSLAYKF